MGIPELTSFMESNEATQKVWEALIIEKIAGRRLIIDGSNLYHWLYFSNAYLMSAATVGGSYPKFYVLVKRFFKTLTERYNLRPIVLMDGVRPQEKLPTRRANRVKSLIAVARYQRPAFTRKSSLSVCPLMAEEVFVDAMEAVLPCEDIRYAEGEADPAIADLANTLRCPVLSQDSDFYMYNVAGGYIPQSSLHLEADGSVVLKDARIFFVRNFGRIGLKHEDLRFIIPASLGNDYLDPAKFNSQELQMTRKDRVQSVMTYAQKFSSLDVFLTTTERCEDLQDLLANFKQAQEQYQIRASSNSVILSKLRPEYQERLRRGCFQTFMAEAALFGQCLFPTVVDDVTKKGSQDISTPIRKTIYEVLGCANPVIEVRRGVQTGIVDVPVQCNDHPRDFNFTSKKERKDILFTMLKCEDYREKICELPDDWQLPVVSAIYWYREGQCPKYIAKALIACFVVYQGSSGHCFPPATLEPRQDSFELETLHFLAQWQCVYIDLIGLNQLLDDPFDYVSPAKLYDGVTVFNYVNTPIKELLEGGDKERYCQVLGIMGVQLEKRYRQPHARYCIDPNKSLIPLTEDTSGFAIVIG